MKVQRKQTSLEVIQWIGNNQTEVDQFIDEKSIREGDALITTLLHRTNKIELNGYVVKGIINMKGKPIALTETDFNLNFEITV